MRPLEVRLRRFGLNQTVAAGLLIVMFFSAVGVIAILLYRPLQSWLARAPHSIARLRENFETVAAPLTMLDRAKNQIEAVSEEVGENQSSIEVSV